MTIREIDMISMTSTASTAKTTETGTTLTATETATEEAPKEDTMMKTSTLRTDSAARTPAETQVGTAETVVGPSRGMMEAEATIEKIHSLPKRELVVIKEPKASKELRE